ncbi:MAG TPA: twin-arginine translocase TatA/TatE family subunit [Thermomicrobiaceae bacterium]|nr:twin-arginine translocase TatA/TatE family subunit [Thermomicrobiaceae bacterium]
MNFFGMGPLEILAITLVAFIIFGPEKLTEIMGGLGRAVREFRAMSSDLTGEFERTISEVKETAGELKQTAGELQSTTRDALTVEGLNPFDQPVFGLQPSGSHTNGASSTAAAPAALQPTRSLGAPPSKTDPLADFAAFGEPAPPRPPTMAEPAVATPPMPAGEAAAEAVETAPEPQASAGAEGETEPETSAAPEAEEASSETSPEAQPERESVATNPNGALDPAADAV